MPVFPAAALALPALLPRPGRLRDGPAPYHHRPGYPMKHLILKAPPRFDPLEAIHQELLFRTAALHERQFPELRYLFAIPNGGFRHKATAAAMQRGGVKRGVPDFCLPIARGGYSGYWGELKRFGGCPSDLSDEQKEWLDFLTRTGSYAAWHKGWEAAWESLQWYLSLPIPTVQ